MQLVHPMTLYFLIFVYLFYFNNANILVHIVFNTYSLSQQTNNSSLLRHNVYFLYIFILNS